MSCGFATTCCVEFRYEIRRDVATKRSLELGNRWKHSVQGRPTMVVQFEAHRLDCLSGADWPLKDLFPDSSGFVLIRATPR
jgi:hypothetical protein